MNKPKPWGEKARNRERERAQDGRPFCFRCRSPRIRCLCSEIEAFPTPMDFIILMHIKEARKVRTGTGRLTHLSLENSELLVAHRFEGHPRVEAILSDPTRQALLLYPGDDAWNLSRRGRPDFLHPSKRPTIFVIDGTWIHARKILYWSPTLQTIPRVVIEPKEVSRFSIKRQPAEGCLSTIEACHALLRDWNGPGGASASPHSGRLLKLLERLVEFQMRCERELHHSRHPPKRNASPS